MAGLAVVQGGGPAQSDALSALRERIRELEGAQVRPTARPCGVSELDALVGGLPVPGLLEINGFPGAGGVRLAVGAAVRLTQQDQVVAWVDGPHRLHPPAVATQGGVLERLLLVRPPRERSVWAAEQLLRSGCFPLVVIVEPRLRGRAGYRWGRACEAGGCCGLVLARRPSRGLPAAVRLSVGQGRVTVVRDRVGARGGRGLPLRPRPPGVDPWRVPDPPWAVAS